MVKAFSTITAALLYFSLLSTSLAGPVSKVTRLSNSKKNSNAILRKNVHEAKGSVKKSSISDDNHFGANDSPVGYDATAMAQQPFPDWLKSVTGLNQWPGIDPPYIPLSFVDLSQIPQNIQPHEMAVCPVDRSSCSFDCYKCVAQDDIYSCPKLSQTFDDGPSPATPKLLENLNHKTTFFTLGINVVRFPEIYKQIQNKGHLIGTHTWGHKFLPSLTNEQIIAEIEWSIWAMNATGGHIPKWFRPPYGGIDNRVRHILRQFGLQAVLWDYDTYDWQLLSNQRTESQIYDEVREWINHPGEKRGLILEHDAHIKTVNVAIELSKNIIGSDQLTAAQCAGGVDYLKVFRAPDEDNDNFDVSTSSVSSDGDGQDQPYVFST